ncbi:MAG TPA: hypothetical protein VEX39_09370 [Thermoleophilaceae bacterium]|nr:hypothetical protein [Thermoleophilaceae bacterium]
MLAVKTYPADYVASCRDRVHALLDAYSGSDAFEPLFCDHVVLALDHYFVHRQRGMEGKDGNPANEVRLLAESIAENDGVLRADKQIRLDPAASVLGLAAGDPIRLGVDDVRRLAGAYFDEIGRRFV